MSEPFPFAQARNLVAAIKRAEQENLENRVDQLPPESPQRKEVIRQRLSLLFELEELGGPLRQAASTIGWGHDWITALMAGLMNAAIAATRWEEGESGPAGRAWDQDADEAYVRDRVEVLLDVLNATGRRGGGSERGPRERLDSLLADLDAALTRAMGLVGGGASDPTEGTVQQHADRTTDAGADHQLPHQEGPFGVVLDPREWRATRDTAVANFAGKENPWKIFQLLCRIYPSITPKADLLNSVWGEGEGSEESLFAHLTSVRKIIKPLGLTVKNTRKVGYRLAELSGHQTRISAKKGSPRRPS
jgi:DNA-binding winged helix-turn-helix (wHTH) protein